MFQMKSIFVLATLAAVAFADSKVYPAGVDPLACPNYPFCGAVSPADFPTPVVNGLPVAPILNTLPDQTTFWQEVCLVFLYIEVRSQKRPLTIFFLSSSGSGC